MLNQVQGRVIAIFLVGLTVGIAAVLYLGGGQEAPKAQAGKVAGIAVARELEPTQIGRYQAFKLDVPNAHAGLLDTTTGKLWALQAFADEPKYRWVVLANGPK
jgi:hypothetical protein